MRNGENADMVMDADSSGRATSLWREARTHEVVMYRDLIHGYQDVLDGKTVEAGIAFAKIRAQRGW